jgi:hypothetical protein
MILFFWIPPNALQLRGKIDYEESSSIVTDKNLPLFQTTKQLKGVFSIQPKKLKLGS